MINDPIIKDIIRDINAVAIGVLAERDRLNTLYSDSLTGNSAVWEILPAQLQQDLRSAIVSNIRTKVAELDVVATALENTGGPV